MCDTNLSYEQLVALNQKLENIRIVWKVYFGNYYLRTDAQYFIAAAWGVTTRSISRTTTSTAGNTAPISKGLDIGHMNITDLSFFCSICRT